MKKILYVLMAAFILSSCGESPKVTVTLTNPLPMDRESEMVEIPVTDVTGKLNLSSASGFVITDANSQEVPYQVTSDQKIIFPAKVKANTTAAYTIKAGTPKEVPVVATGRHYQERVDDIAWENDLVAFRAYGPALQATGERAYGYDVWTKYNTTEPVVEARYAMELNPETLAKIETLKKTDPAAARELRQATSYHVDHGNGLDTYKVGPTLGGGTSALMAGEEIIYPYAYKTYKIHDNGPLRFKVELVYNPLTVNGNSNVIETRVITLDAGSHMNKTVINYSGLNETTPVATGLVLHEPDGDIVADASNGYITYVDPTDSPSGSNGKIFVGAAFPNPVKEAKPVLFGEAERKDRGADGHVLAISDYQPGSEYTYYWGSAWNRANIKDAATWNKYVADYALKVRNPLVVQVK